MKSFLVIAMLLFGALNSHAQQTTGLFQYDWPTQEGFTLWCGLQPGQTQFLMNDCGEVVHSWTSENTKPANSMYLLADGSMLYPAVHDTALNSPIGAGGGGERIIHKDWDGNESWNFIYYDETVRLHHDIEPLPNGNVLAIAWVLIDSLTAVSAGRNPELLSENELYSERVIEVQQTGPNSGTIVWQWDLWDHLVQDHDAQKDNFGVIADHPELLDLNWYNVALNDDTGRADFVHLNAIDYNADLDQIVLSSQVHNEIWIIDHSTTTQEAAGHSGGTYGKGGDFLYRFGNPQVYDRGNAEDQILWRQHDANWIPNGFEDEGGIMIYNNGLDRNPSFSEVDVITPPQQTPGVYTLMPGQPYGPETKDWNYHAEDSTSFYSWFISGARRLPNGNTFICEGSEGRFFEVTHDGEKVWEYVSPIVNGPDTLASTEPIDGVNNYVFRAQKYPAYFSGFVGRDLSSGVQLEANPILSSCIVGTNDFDFEEALNLYPNPTDGELTLQGLNGAEVTIYGMQGQLISNFVLMSENELIDLSGLPSGIYSVRIQFENKQTSRKVILF